MLGGVAHGNVEMAGAGFLEERLRLAVKLGERFAGVFPRDFHVVPAERLADSRAECLRDGFLGGESCGDVWGGVGVAQAVFPLGR